VTIPEAVSSYRLGIHRSCEAGTGRETLKIQRDSLLKRVFVQSFGCRASQADGAGIEAALEQQGISSTSQAAEADLIVLNTCTVTSNADVDARHAIRRLHRENPNARILVTGCFAQRAPDELAALDGVTWVVGNSHKTIIPEIVLSPLESSEEYHGQVFRGDLSKAREFLSAPVIDAYGDRTRPNLKVQDGCSNKCSFCIIPSVRGLSRSAPLDSVIAQMYTLAERYCEVVLSGINLGRWGRDLPGSLRFIDLVKTILAQTSVKRLRVSSVEPMDWSSDLIEFMAREPRIARHVHMPLQSGSDSVLKRMYRKYRVRHYVSGLDLVHKLMPAAAIGADVMTGFPGETDSEFEETRRFIEQQPFTYLHVFTYSERPGTLAASNSDQVPVEVRRQRTHVLRQLGEEKNLNFRMSLRGQKLSAVTLNNQTALTTNFLHVELNQRREANQMVEVVVGAPSAKGIREQEHFPVLTA
jgi:threonylcarbamoyladenosine tRNA methylthiotransferase MtaB